MDVGLGKIALNPMNKGDSGPFVPMNVPPDSLREGQDRSGHSCETEVPSEREQPMCAAVPPTTGDSSAATKPVRGPALWGIAFGALQAASPLAFWWLDAATVYALGLALIASIYIGFAVADGRPAVIAVESSVATVFVIVAAVAVTGSPWLLVLGLTGHGFKDLWQHRRHFVANTRWWPPFCLVVDWIAAAAIAIEIIAGVHFR
jgi:hypothetical protein